MYVAAGFMPMFAHGSGQSRQLDPKNCDGYHQREQGEAGEEEVEGDQRYMHEWSQRLTEDEFG